MCVWNEPSRDDLEGVLSFVVDFSDAEWNYPKEKVFEVIETLFENLFRDTCVM